MTANIKRKTLILLGVITLITMMIAANLPQLEFQPGMPLPRLESGQVVAVSIEEEPAVSISAPTFIFVLIALILTTVALYLMAQLFRGADWKSISDVLRPLLIVSAVIGGLVFLLTLFPGSDSYTPVRFTVSTSGPVVTVAARVSLGHGWFCSRREADRISTLPDDFRFSGCAGRLGPPGTRFCIGESFLCVTNPAL